MLIKVRKPIAAGNLYSNNKDILIGQIESTYKHKMGPEEGKKEEIIAGIVPHGSYNYSGSVAAWLYSRLKKSNFIILGPNHNNVGAKFASIKDVLWDTPLGGIAVDSRLVDKILENKHVEFDMLAHEYEQSIEVQLPLLQHQFSSDFKFVPISVISETATDDFLEECREVANDITKAIKSEKENCTIIATSDFSHTAVDSMKKIDNQIIDTIIKLNERKFFEKINATNSNICGFGPIAIAIMASKQLGAKKAKLLKYATSVEITGDTSNLFGYASIIIY